MSDEKTGLERAPVRDSIQTPRAQAGPLPQSVVRTTALHRCEDCRATTAFHAWNTVELAPSFNTFVASRIMGFRQQVSGPSSSSSPDR